MRASNHVRFEGFASPLRLTTNVPISYLQGQPFALTERRHMLLSWGEAIEEPLEPMCERFTNYLFSVAEGSPDLNLAPLYGIDGTPVPEERLLSDWAGYEGERPVRAGNAASPRWAELL